MRAPVYFIVVDRQGVPKQRRRHPLVFKTLSGAKAACWFDGDSVVRLTAAPIPEYIRGPEGNSYSTTECACVGTFAGVDAYREHLPCPLVRK